MSYLVVISFIILLFVTGINLLLPFLQVKELDRELQEIQTTNVEAIARRAKSARRGRWICLLLFVLAGAYFGNLNLTQGYPIDWKAIALPGISSIVFAVLEFRYNRVLATLQLQGMPNANTSNKPVQRTGAGARR